MSDYRFDTLDVLNSLLEATRGGYGANGDLWAVAIANNGDVHQGVKVVAIFPSEEFAVMARKALVPSFKADDHTTKDTLAVIQLVNVPLALGPALPGLPAAPPLPRTPTRPAMPPRRFVGRRRP